MGALKLAYYEQGTLEKNNFLKVVCSEKGRTDLKNALDYYAFGSLMPSRNGSSGDYRYGFNGMEKDDEMHNQGGTSYDFGARQYDARLGRWLSIDPLAVKYPDLSPYSFVANDPVSKIDPDGKRIKDAFGRTVRVKINKDPNKKGSYIAKFIYKKGTTAADKVNFEANGGRIISAMLKTKKGKQMVRMAKSSAISIHYNLIEDPIIEKSVGKKTQYAYGYAIPKEGAKEISTGPNAGQFEEYEITISLGSFRYGKTEEAKKNADDPERLYTGSEEEFLNGVGTHETTHPFSNIIAEIKGAILGVFNTKTKLPYPNEESQNQYYELEEATPTRNENKSREQYNAPK
jgi:RHS repeat-associated protein